jgi:lysyl-tRNA synthetase class II
MFRDDISTDEEKQCTMWFQKLDIGDFIGVRGTVLKRKWEKSRFMFMD